MSTNLSHVPLDLDNVWNVTTGAVRASGALADGYFWRGKRLAANAPALVGQLPIEEGDSGGAVFDRRGEVVGMACALRRQCPLAAVVISAPAIRRFLNAPDPPKRLLLALHRDDNPNAALGAELVEAIRTRIAATIAGDPALAGLQPG